ncbi:uncharacterized protein LOC144152414 [Haemaphysalis longicornis]
MDTTPDLTFTKNLVNDPQWINLLENLGSDHFIVATRLTAGPPNHKRGNLIKITNWDEFRRIRAAEREISEEAGCITDIEEFVEQLHTHARKATKTIPEEAELQEADTKLLHMWEAKQSLQRRLSKQKLNRNLRRRIAYLNREIEEYANELTRQNWYSTCNRMDSEMGLGKTWNILRYLIDSQECKTTQRHNLSKIIHDYPRSDKDLLEEIKNRYIGSNPKENLKPYEGTPNPELDRPITTAEVWEAIQDLRTKSAPGQDGITNKIIRNLDDDSVEALAQYLNLRWQMGSIPKQWKTATIIMIPKPGKKLGLENLRPISLTSCLGKLMEHVVLRRLNKYMEDKDLYPHTMIGFRPKLSTQDVLLQLKHQIVDGNGTSSRDTKAILGLDLTKAFDNVRHSAILENLGMLGIGSRTYSYVRDFLSDRTAKIKIGSIESNELELGARGTPQGSVLSPFLFNIAMIGLPAELKKIEGLHHSIYADDLTLWVTGGSDGAIQDTLQEAINTIETYIEPRGLVCSPEKSEILLYQANRGRRKGSYKSTIELQAKGGLIPIVPMIKVLGLRIQANGHNTEALRMLEKSVLQTTRLISRVANRHQGIKEANLIRLVQAFVLSRVVYVAPFLSLKTYERTKINNMIRKVYKQALGIPITTPTNKFDALGLHNSLDELIEAQQISQLERLTKSQTGRHVLRSLSIGYDSQHGHKVDISPEARAHLHIPPLPRNMHPVHNQARRQERAKAIHKRFEKIREAIYFDAAEYSDRTAMAITAVNQHGHLITSGSVRASPPETGEEAAIALALASTRARYIISDSKTAIRNFSRGRISAEALKIMNGYRGERLRRVQLIWAPGHTALPGNEDAHNLARGLTGRASARSTTEQPSPRNGSKRMVTYREIIDHYRLGRLKYPEAHKTLHKKQSVAWRLLQTGMYPNPVLYNHYYPDLHSDRCKNCTGRADLKHMLWACPAITSTDKARRMISTPEQWETILLSSDAESQSWAVRMAEAAAKEQGLLADG